MNQGAEMVGASGGAVTGFLLGGLVGAGVGAAAGSFIANKLRSAGEEVLRRYLSPREQQRIGMVLAAATEAIQEKIAQGHQPRQDGFFEAQASERSTADEITEGVLIAAQREFEEKKIYFMGRLLANIAFDDSTDRAQANFLVRTAESLSYRGLCILFVAGNVNEFGLFDKAFGQYNAPQPPGLPSLLTEIFTLIGQSLLHFSKSEVPRIVYMVPAKMRLQGVGTDLYQLVDLEQLRDRPQDWEPIVKLLQPPMP